MTKTKFKDLVLSAIGKGCSRFQIITDFDNSSFTHYYRIKLTYANKEGLHVENLWYPTLARFKHYGQDHMKNYDQQDLRDNSVKKFEKYLNEIINKSEVTSK